MINDAIPYSSKKKRFEGSGDGNAGSFVPYIYKKIVYNVPGFFKGG
jgi:hypothetical protein